MTQELEMFHHSKSEYWKMKPLKLMAKWLIDYETDDEDEVLDFNEFMSTIY